MQHKFDDSLNHSTFFKNRFLLLDVMRAFAVLMMIQGHTADALLHPAYLDHSAISWKIWEFFRGLTAPIFLFGSGFAYVIATLRKMENGKLPHSVYVKRLRWIAVLYVTGSLMHIPKPSLPEIQAMTSAQWSVFFQVDILRHMAVSLLLLLGIFSLCRSLKQILITTSIIGGSIILFTPIAHDIHWMAFLPEPIAAHFSMQTGSFFPLFPFAGYLFAGSTAAAIYLMWEKNGLSSILAKRYTIAALIFITASFIFDNVPLQIYPTYNYWKTSPNLFLFRVGCVLLLWAGFQQIIRHIKNMPQIIPIIGQHTLSIYASHVIFLYGCAWYNGLTFWFGKVLTPLQIVGIILFLLIGSAGLAYSLNYLKINSKLAYRGIQFAATAGIAFLIILR